jgi:DNA-binding CsgD family transcriptional regulator
MGSCVRFQLGLCSAAMNLGTGRVFVGRSREQTLLSKALADADAGNARIIMIAGEAGIGKTALCRQISLAAGERGMRVLAGQCYEQGSLNSPYLPFVEAIEGYTREGWPYGEWDQSRVLARIAPELRKLGFEPPLLTEGESPYLLFEAVAEFLRLAAARQPIVLLLEDLHDADEGSLDLLAHLGRRLGRARALIIATCRDTEVAPSQPLSATLAALQRSEIFERIRLRGLVAEELGELFEAMTGEPPASGMAESLHLQTEGNPLFATETIRHLEAEGLLIAGRAADLGAVPEGLRDVIGRRVLKLSEACRDVLTTAAVIGRDFRLDVLGRLYEKSVPSMLESVHDAEASRIIAEHEAGGGPVAYHFSHALFRQYLYEATPATRRQAIHVRVAAAFQAVFKSGDDEYAEAIAEHLTHSTDPGDMARTVQLWESAAGRASSVFAYADAARLTRRALNALERVETEDQARRCDLLLMLSAALTEGGQPRAALDGPTEEAFALARALGDDPRATRAAMTARMALAFDDPWRGLSSAESKKWGLRLDQHSEPGTPESVVAAVNLAAIEFAQGSSWPCDSLFEAARDLAWEIGDPDGCWFAGAQRLFYPRSSARTEDKKATISALRALPRDGVSTATLAMGFFMVSEALIQFGDRTSAEPLWEDLAALARRTGALFTRNYASLAKYTSSVLDGRFDDGLGALAEAEEAVRAAGVRRLSGNVGRGYRAMLHLGLRPDPALLDDVNPWVRAAFMAASGEHAAVARFLNLAQTGRRARNPLAYWNLALCLEVALAAKDREWVSDFVSQIEGTSEVTNSLVIINRLVGEAKAFLGHPVEARARLARGIEQAEAMHFRPEAALTRLALAALLFDLDPGDVDEPRRLLETAVPEFLEMGMRPGLERAQLLWGQVEAAKAAVGHRRRRAGGLTEREAEVLRLLATGKTNREISADLVLSIRTVERHIANIYSKIDAHGKADATAFAIHNRLV